MQNNGIILWPWLQKSFEVFTDTDFVGNWHKMTVPADLSTAKSRSGYVISYTRCLIAWASKLQTSIMLSSTEVEYISLLQSLCDTIPLMELIKEFKLHGFIVCSDEPRVYCKAFEDNAGALKLTQLPMLHPRTKHINIIYHHFREHVQQGIIKIFPIQTDDQVADIFMKPLPQNLFLKHRKTLLHF